LINNQNTSVKMGFSQYLYLTLNKNRALYEAVVAASPVIDFNSIKNQIEANVGGDIDSKNAIDTSFEGLEKAFDAVPLDYLEKNTNAHLEDFFILVVDAKRIDFLNKFAEREKTAAEGIVNTLASIDRDRDQMKFISLLKSYTTVTERLLKIYRLLTGQTEVTNESVTVDPSVKTKIDKIIVTCKSGATADFDKLLSAEGTTIDNIPETEEGADKFFRYKDLMDFLGLATFLKEKIDAKEKKIDVVEKKESVSTKRKKRIIDSRLIKGIQYAKLPTISNDIIETPGELFRMFKTLEKKNLPWMTLALERYVFKGDATRAKEFEANGRVTESPKEEDQLTYLMANNSWTLSYIKGAVDGELAEKEETNYIARLATVTAEKEKEIKSYYLSRDFNLGNFSGLQLKPEIRLPLHVRVPLPVTDADRKKESPLRNVLKGLGQIISGMLGAIPDKGNEANAQKARKRNIAVFNGINSIVRGTVGAIGGKQAGRDYAEKTANIVPGGDKKQIKEDMVGLGDAGGAIVNPESPGQTMQTPGSLAGDMDTLSLLGPGRKLTTKKATKKKKKKSTKPVVNSRVSSFSDFMQRK